jgi:chaperonin cofactor prefoldin
MITKFIFLSRLFAILLIIFNFSFIQLKSIAAVSNTSNETPVGFTQRDRDRLIRIEAVLEQHEKRFESIEKRFDNIDKRFESIDKRFESIDKRFEELRSDMNTHFGWLIALFAAITISTISFALWDRRTMIRPFETKVKEIDKLIEELKEEKTANKILSALREMAKKDNQLAEILKSHNLL